MNVHYIIMARKVNLKLGERLEKAAISMIVKKGYAGASVAEIAGEAGVSSGYLYSHYKNKEDLVRSIYENRVEEFDNFIDTAIRECATVREAMVKITSYMFSMSDSKPDLVKFLFFLINEHRFHVPVSRMRATRNQCVAIREKGAATGEISPKLSLEDIFIIFFSIPLQQMQIRIDAKPKKRKFTPADVERVTTFCMKAAS